MSKFRFYYFDLNVNGIIVCGVFFWLLSSLTNNFFTLQYVSRAKDTNG